jgi:hypothetical protein
MSGNDGGLAGIIFMGLALLVCLATLGGILWTIFTRMM